MSLFNPIIPGTTESSKAPTPNPQPKDRVLDSSTHDTRDLPISSLLTEIDGYPWAVDYYQAILGGDDPVDSFNFSRNEVFKQYHRISSYELRVQSPVSYSFEKDRQTHKLDGDGVIIPGTIMPSLADFFIADVGNGRKGIFMMTEVTPLSIMMERAYSVSYRLAYMLDAPKQRAITDSVVKESYFNKDFMRYNTSPIVSEGTRDVSKVLKGIYNTLLNTFTSNFINRDTRYLQIPDQQRNAVDFFVTNFIASTIDTSSNKDLSRCNWPTFPFTLDQNKFSIWDLILKNKPMTEGWLSNQLLHKVGLCNTINFKVEPWFTSIYYSNIVLLLYPKIEGSKYFNNMLELKGDVYVTPTPEPTEPVIPEEPVDPDNLPNLDDINAEDIAPSPKFHGVLEDDYYVLSEAFYLNRPEDQSLLEQMVSNMLKGTVVSIPIVIDLAETLQGLPNLERFYYTPILLSLIRYVTKGL